MSTKTRIDVPMRLAVPVNPDGNVAPCWGQASQVAVAEVNGSWNRICGWRVHRVDWDDSYAHSSRASHHNRVLRFLADQEVEMVVAGPRLGLPMARTLASAGIHAVLGATGDARQAALAAVGPTEH